MRSVDLLEPVPTELDRVMHEQGRMNIWLARKLNVTPSTVTRWRSGKLGATEENMKAIAVALGRSPEDGPSLFSPQSTSSDARHTHLDGARRG